MLLQECFICPQEGICYTCRSPPPLTCVCMYLFAYMDGITHAGISSLLLQLVRVGDWGTGTGGVTFLWTVVWWHGWDAVVPFSDFHFNGFPFVLMYFFLLIRGSLCISCRMLLAFSPLASVHKEQRAMTAACHYILLIRAECGMNLSW